ncbi:methyltransferase domain-containing protein [Streptomyces sp. DG2A-72]|uniref:class I SAM-dependent methyltransferase n=1 Tax=Streptomyces sp. DG2A-72 TaxID=3051386 RepID=UPI00265B8E66|nr:class I SAM-dependent methyltransferase [Streptomyces sp. DG2A-72]MDO0939106.1 methyltransferase domain-containing protein [Streptomyces sp. DG2A-72]
MEPCELAAGLADGAESFDRLFSALWSSIGAATVKAARLRPGVHVFDACCGSGASAILAAEEIGPHGVIDAVDLAEPLLERGRAQATVRGLGNVRFVHGDVLDWPAPHGGYDAVVCSLGIFSFPDMAAGTERLLRLLRPGGRLAATIWARGALEPLPELIHRAVLPERPYLADAPRPVNPLEPIGTPESFRDWLAARSLSSVGVQCLPLALPGDPDLLWSLVLGTGFRGLLGGLPVAAVERVRRRFTAGLLAEGRDAIDFSALVGTGTLRRVALPRRPGGARPLLTTGEPIRSAPQIG